MGEWEGPSPTPQTFAAILPKWWKVAKLWFYGDDKLLARGYLIAAVVLSLLYTWLLVTISYAQRNFSTAMSEKRVAEFYQAVWMFVLIIAIAAPLFAFVNFVEGRLALAWRIFLVKKMVRGYFANRAFFTLNQYGVVVDNPDQRICDDIASFVASSVMLATEVLRKIMSCVAFAGVLWSISPSLVVYLFLYAGAGTWFTTWVFGKPLMSLNFRLLQKEGDLRFSLVRVRENNESIAFYKGEGREKSIVSDRFDKVVFTKISKINWAAGLGLWSNVYSYSTILVPSLFTAPLYFAGMIEFGVISQASYAFGRIEAALGAIVANFQEISGLAAQTERLAVMMDVLEDIEREGDANAAGRQGQHIVHLESQSPVVLQLEGLTFSTPGDKQYICDNQDVTLLQGEKLLIVGPTGCGKSSLLRAISGLWSRGKGTIRTPDVSSMFFLPQKPYMPLGTLRDQLLFPTSAWGSGHDEANLSDAKLLALLRTVRLPGLADRVGGLDVEMDWSQVLSLGEQQRVAFLRLLLHRASLAFLDEATSALDINTEAALYEALNVAVGSYVSVGHRPQLVKYHTHVLEFVGNGSWLKYPASEFDARSQYGKGGAG
ncbi:unnamed protein product [Ostreobium quekettii]|uniref:Uncharacterized protein n=1 Tax=Ostreobium quekettii TaxID=121088 RepID=A0A8S1JAT4_9CHLO|nr:unnamed protein product [Ostreobium quekettii]